MRERGEAISPECLHEIGKLAISPVRNPANSESGLMAQGYQRVDSCGAERGSEARECGDEREAERGGGEDERIERRDFEQRSPHQAREKCGESAADQDAEYC